MLTFKEEIKELCAKYNKRQMDVCEEIGINKVTLSRIMAEEFIPSQEMLFNLKTALPALDLDKWNIYFGKMPDDFYEACRKNPDFVKRMVLETIKEVFSNRANRELRR